MADDVKDGGTEAVGLDRREFTVAAVMAMLAGVTITVGGCGGGGGGTGPSPTQSPSSDPSTGDRLGNVSANHGHVARLESARLTAGNAVTIDIRGTADHPHSVSLTADEVVAIRNGQRVGKGSTDEDFHTHTVTFN